MEVGKTVAVWLICKDGKQAGKVLLQQRAEKRIEDGREGKQSFPYVCQPTWNGKIEETIDRAEAISRTVAREAIEELGIAFADSFDFSSLTLFYTGEFERGGKKWTAYNYVGAVPQWQLKRIMLHKGAMPNLLGVNSNDWPKIKVVGQEGIDPKSQIVLFEDQYRALRVLFSLGAILAYLR